MSMRDLIAKAMAEAERRAAGRTPLPGLPREPVKIGMPEELFVPGPVGAVHDVVDKYMVGKKIDKPFPTKFHPIDKSAATRVAETYDALPMYDPNALQSYDAMIRETLAQYQAMKAAGIKIAPVDSAGYGAMYPGNSPRGVVKDIAENKRMGVFKSEEGFGTGHDVQHPLLAQSGIVEQGYPMTHNDLFRAVHDFYGHAKEGYGFRGAGEDNAFRSHAAMYSPLARPAMTTETRGQNSWLNYGPHGDFNRTAKTADTIFAPQKVATLPDWVMKYVVPGGIGLGALAAAAGSDRAQAMGALADQDGYGAQQ